jgi:hypothetical protein
MFVVLATCAVGQGRRADVTPDENLESAAVEVLYRKWLQASEGNTSLRIPLGFARGISVGSSQQRG